MQRSKISYICTLHSPATHRARQLRQVQKLVQKSDVWWKPKPISRESVCRLFNWLRSVYTLSSLSTQPVSATEGHLSFAPDRAFSKVWVCVNRLLNERTPLCECALLRSLYKQLHSNRISRLAVVDCRLAIGLRVLNESRASRVAALDQGKRPSGGGRSY